MEIYKLAKSRLLAKDDSVFGDEASGLGTKLELHMCRP